MEEKIYYSCSQTKTNYVLKTFWHKNFDVKYSKKSKERKWFFFRNFAYLFCLCQLILSILSFFVGPKDSRQSFPLTFIDLFIRLKKNCEQKIQNCYNAENCQNIKTCLLIVLCNLNRCRWNFYDVLNCRVLKKTKRVLNFVKIKAVNHS